MDAAEQAEKDYEQGRLAGLTDALIFISEITSGLSPAERNLIFDKVQGPLYAESKRRRGES